MLNSVQVKNLSKPGLHSVGDGLYVEVANDGSKVWSFRYQLHGRRRQMGLGVVTTANGLAVARQAVRDARSLIGRGVDPIDERKRPQGVPTFAQHAEVVITDLKPGWRGAKTEAGWRRSLLQHAKKLGPRPVDQITTADVLPVLRAYWSTQPESGGKLRERMERVLDSAKVAGFIKSPWENPARWKGHLEHILPKRGKLTRGHHRALHYEHAPAFYQRLRTQRGTGALALRFAILTSTRENMIMGADWTEIRGDIWTVPADRMKMAEEYRIKLSAEALAVLEVIAENGRTGYIFKGSKRGTHISNATMDKVCKTMKVNATPHGFRTTFRDWAGDCTDHPREVAEMCLSHLVGDVVEQAYRRSDALAKRGRLWADWADYLLTPATSDQSEP